MADLLGDVDVNIQPQAPFQTIKSTSRRKTRVLSPPVSQEKKMSAPKQNDHNPVVKMLSTPPLEANYDDDDGFMGNVDDDIFPSNDPIPSSPTANAAERKGHGVIKVEEDDDDLMEVAQAIGGKDSKAASVNMSGSRPASKVVKEPAYPSPASSSPPHPPAAEVDASAWNDVTSKLNVVSSQDTQFTSFGKLNMEDAIEKDGSLMMFWTDYTEVNGSLCLFGKVKNQKSGSFVSAFIKIDNILRKLYFLPRTLRHSRSRLISLASSF